MLRKAVDYLEKLAAPYDGKPLPPEGEKLMAEVRVFLPKAKKHLAELPAQLEIIRKAWAAAFGVAEAAQSTKSENSCDRCGVDPAGTVYGPKDYRGQLCRNCYGGYVRDIIQKTPFPKNAAELLERQIALRRLVAEHSDLTGEGMSGDMNDLGLVDWIDAATGNLDPSPPAAT